MVRAQIRSLQIAKFQTCLVLSRSKPEKISLSEISLPCPPSFSSPSSYISNLQPYQQYRELEHPRFDELLDVRMWYHRRCFEKCCDEWTRRLSSYKPHVVEQCRNRT